MRLVLDLLEQLVRLRGVALDQVVGELELDRERDELLLGAVVDVALQPATAFVLRRDQALLRGLQLVEPHLELLVQADVAEHQPRLTGEVGDQLLVGGRHRVARRLADRERAQQLARLLDRVDAIDAAIAATEPFGSGDRRRRSTSARPGRHVAQLLFDGEPHVRSVGADALTEHPRHPRQHVLVSVCLADPFGEFRRAPRTGSPASRRRAGSRSAHTGAHGLERHGDDHGGEHREERAVAAEPCARAQHDREIHERGEQRQQRVDDRLADDDVQVVEPVPEDGHPDRDGQQEERRARHDRIEEERIVRDEEVRSSGRRENTTSIANATHLICCRSTPSALWNRTTSETHRAGEQDQEDEPEVDEPTERRLDRRDVEGVRHPDLVGIAGQPFRRRTRRPRRSTRGSRRSAHRNGLHRGDGRRPSGKRSGSRNRTGRMPRGHPRLARIATALSRNPDRVRLRRGCPGSRPSRTGSPPSRPPQQERRRSRCAARG